MKTLPWTDQRVTSLKKLWLSGFSAAQVAKQLGGTSRSAVIGKANRLGLRRGAQSVKATQDLTRVFQTGAKAPVTAEPRRERPHDGPVVPLLDLSPHACRWPVGDPRSPAFGFCGRRQADGAPYCPEHKAAAWVGKPAKRDPWVAPVGMNRRVR